MDWSSGATGVVEHMLVEHTKAVPQPSGMMSTKVVPVPIRSYVMYIMVRYGTLKVTYRTLKVTYRTYVSHVSYLRKYRIVLIQPYSAYRGMKHESEVHVALTVDFTITLIVSTP